MWSYVLVVCSFLLQNSIPLYGYIITSFSHSLLDRLSYCLQVCFCFGFWFFWPLWIVLQEHVFPFLSGIILEVELLGCISLCLTLSETTELFSRGGIQFYIYQQCSSFFTPLPAIINVYPFDCSHFSGCVVVSYCGFNWNLSNDIEHIVMCFLSSANKIRFYCLNYHIFKLIQFCWCLSFFL